MVGQVAPTASHTSSHTKAHLRDRVASTPLPVHVTYWSPSPNLIHLIVRLSCITPDCDLVCQLQSTISMSQIPCPSTRTMSKRGGCHLRRMRSYYLRHIFTVCTTQAGSHGELEDVTTPPGPYVILSRTWGADDDEVSFDALENKTGAEKIGYTKLRFCANEARKDGLQYFWVDTCCINKQSSTEFSEAINSMYNWYQSAKLCYVYLNDVEKTSWRRSISKSRWFKRGWTLQELLAPPRDIICDRLWQRLGGKSALAGRIASITRIHATALTSGNLAEYSVAQRMSWATRRVTTRAEDSAYCLLGLFGVNMPLLYGEGQ
jgi:hypothetical protein